MTPVPSIGKLIKFEITDKELAAVVALMDAGVRASGLQSVRLELLTVLEKFQTAANKSEEAPAE
jgi:hypothetical protein